MSGSAHTAQIRLSVSVKRPPPRTASMAALQKRVALLDRQQASRAHDDPKLGIGQANHVPMMIQKRFSREKSGSVHFDPLRETRAGIISRHHGIT